MGKSTESKQYTENNKTLPFSTRRGDNVNVVLLAATPMSTTTIPASTSASDPLKLGEVPPPPSPPRAVTRYARAAPLLTDVDRGDSCRLGRWSGEVRGGWEGGAKQVRSLVACHTSSHLVVPIFSMDYTCMPTFPGRTGTSSVFYRPCMAVRVWERWRIGGVFLYSGRGLCCDAIFSCLLGEGFSDRDRRARALGNDAMGDTNRPTPIPAVCSSAAAVE